MNPASMPEQSRIIVASRTEKSELFEPMANDCEHHWISIHQPDFPKPIYWIQQCSQCQTINGADLADQLAEPRRTRGFRMFWRKKDPEAE